MRGEEIRNILEDLKDANHILALEGDPRQVVDLARDIRSLLKAAKLGDLAKSWKKNLDCPEFAELANLAPYRYIRRVEKVLLPEEYTSIRSDRGKPSAEASRHAYTYKDTPHIGVSKKLHHHWVDFVTSSAPKCETLRRAEIQKMMDTVENGIRERQKLKAVELREWRDQEVRCWKDELEKSEPVTGDAQPQRP